MENFQTQEETRLRESYGEARKNIPTWLGMIIIIFIALIAGGAILSFQYSYREAEDPSLIGGQKDDHGCLISAGYSWCEAKQKCLRTWEEKCEADQNSNLKTYANSEYGFEIKYPESSIVNQNPDPYRPNSKVRILMSEKFSDTGSVTIDVDNTKSESKCKNSVDPLPAASAIKQINGINFSVVSFPDDAMGGQRGISTSYYTFHNNLCYKISALVGWHSVQFTHDATDGLKATDEELAKENEEIEARKSFAESVVSTFRFTK